MLTVAQSVWHVLYSGPGAPYASIRILQVRWYLSADRNPGHTIALQGTVPRRPSRSKARTADLELAKRLRRPVLGPPPGVYHHGWRLVPGAVCLRVQLVLVDTHLPGGQGPPVAAEDDALLQMGHRAADPRGLGVSGHRAHLAGRERPDHAREPPVPALHSATLQEDQHYLWTQGGYGGRLWGPAATLAEAEGGGGEVHSWHRRSPTRSAER